MAKHYRGREETPKTAETPRLAVRYYPKAGKLQLLKRWKDREGNYQVGPGVTLDAEDLQLAAEALELIEEFVGSLGRGGRP
ncbi:MAG TPA: hypothetical protein GXX55_03525 [Firmicutes bacterium]|nr:hypothetical protein [Bacillota bacterium]